MGHISSSTKRRSCPSCGRYVGPREACPYCGARMGRRIPIHVVKIAALVFASLGLAVLWFVAIRAEVPKIAIGQASATMNMAYVRVEGRCNRVPSYDPETDYLSFWIEDETGEVRVVTYRAETRQLIEQGRVPALGDQIEVAGTLRVREDYVSLTINVPEQLTITRAEPVGCDIGSISPEDRYQRVRVCGEVRSVFKPYDSLTLITVRDGTGAIPIAIDEDLIALSGVTPTLTVGQPVEVVGAVSLYDDTQQLVPASTADIVSLDQEVPSAVEKPIGELAASGVGQLVLVHGTVTEVASSSKGVKLTLDDGTGTVVVLLWQDVYNELRNGPVPSVGAEIRVRGELSQYRGVLEVVPEAAEDVQVTEVPTRSPEPTGTSLPTDTPAVRPTPTPSNTSTPRPTPTPEDTPTPVVDLMPIEAITAQRVGEEVTVEGVIVNAASFSKGFKFTLDDGTGQIVLLMWHEIYDDCWDAGEINRGAEVRITGEIGQYEGELQIQPGFGGDVKVVEGAPTPANPREIGSLGGEDEGRRVMVEGEVVRVEGLSSAVKVFIRDGTGEILVFVWRNVLDRIENNTALGTPGSRVRVVGTVELYKSNLEVVPTLPNDVTVLETP